MVGIFPEIPNDTECVLVGSSGCVAGSVVKCPQAARSHGRSASGQNTVTLGLNIRSKRLNLRLEMAGSAHTTHSTKVRRRRDNIDVTMQSAGKAVTHSANDVFG